MKRAPLLLLASGIALALILLGIVGDNSSDKAESVGAPPQTLANEERLGLSDVAGRPELPDGVMESAPRPDEASDSPRVQSAQSSDAGLSTDAEMSDDARPVWPQDPGLLEALVLAEWQRLGLPAGIDPVECTTTDCRIRYISPTGCDYRPFLQTARNPPISAVDMRWGMAVAPSGMECTVTLSSYRYPRPEPGQFSVSADRLREEAAKYIAEGDYNVGPVSFYGVQFGSSPSADVMVENVCIRDCATDGRQMIYIAVPENTTCEELRGVEERFMARTSSGGLDERTFCIPNTLVGD